jgi:TusA-related sulfurtransferase
VRARLALERMQPGETLELILDGGEPLRSVPVSAREEGHHVTVRGERVTIEKA